MIFAANCRIRGSKVVVGARNVAFGVKTRVVALKLYCAVVMALKFARLVTLNASKISRSVARSVQREYRA